MNMTTDRINAIVASAYNACSTDEVRKAFPNGVRPSDAADFSKGGKALYLSLYREYASDKKNSPLYTPSEIDSAMLAVLA